MNKMELINIKIFCRCGGVKKLKKGLIQVYTGNGKGKTTAALGLALRALGHGYRVCMVQFMKGGVRYGEIEIAKKLDNFEVKSFGRPEFVDKNNPEEIDIKLAHEALNYASEIIKSRKCDIVILDEINVALEWKLIKLSDVLDILKSKPEDVEIILTGRYAPKEIINLADLVTEMKEIKHPYQKGVKAREGIEF